MDLSRSIDFLLENAGDVIQYRLHKEILCDINKTEEENLLEKVLQSPNFKTVESYANENGYIGRGMHTGNNKESQLKDGEAAARLLSSYAIPKDSLIIKNYITALRNDEILEEEFSFSSSATRFYRDRFLGLNSGFSLMTLIYTMQAMLGYGDDIEVKQYQEIAFKAFVNVLKLDSISDILKINHRKIKYNYPYIEEDTLLPSIYHLAELAYTENWKSPVNTNLIAQALNHRNIIVPIKNDMQVKIRNNYYSVGLLFRPFKAFNENIIDFILYRRILTEIAMLGVGEKVDIIRESVANIEEALIKDGILKWKLSSYQKQQLKRYKFPAAYCDIWLEDNHKKINAIECDLTFWAVQFLTLVKNSI